MRRRIATILLLACTAAPAAGDIVHLTNGTTLQGRIKRADADEWVVYAADHRATFVKLEDVALIELTARPADDPVAAAGRLDALRRSVAHADDPARAIDQYRKFIAGGADPATLRRARQDLAVWQDRADRRLARLGDRWVAAAARDQAVADALSLAGRARLLIKQGRFADADALLATSLEIDPQNPTALYLRGLLQCQQNQLTAGRDSFEAVAAAVPNHGPTLVNLAVVAWWQGRYAAALERYDQAMVASPANPAALADVEAALADLPEDTVGRHLVDRVADRYQAQEKQLVAQMARRGLHRFGTAWLTEGELAEARRAGQQDKAALDQLAVDFERVQDQVRQTDLAIAAVAEQEGRSVAVAQMPGPWLASYDGGDVPPVLTVAGELRNDADQLQRRRATQVAQLDALQRQASAIRRRTAAEPGRAQRLIGPEGTPLALPRP